MTKVQFLKQYCTSSVDENNHTFLARKISAQFPQMLLVQRKKGLTQFLVIEVNEGSRK